MKEQLISFKTSKLAYQKGYTREAVSISFTSARRNYYNAKGQLNGDCTDFVKDIVNYGREKAKVKHILYPATSQSLLQKWLREEHELVVLIEGGYMKQYGKYSAVLLGNKEGLYHHKLDGFTIFKTYEKALEEGLQEALKLI